MTALLSLRTLTAGHGQAMVLDGVSLDVHAGRNLALLGCNGAGKTTLLETLMGQTTVFAGRILFDGCDLTQQPAHVRARAGLGWVPQEREVFPSLTVEENLRVVSRPGHWSLERAYRLFPRLRERRANGGNQLSGGEQQLLAIARALMTNPRLLLLDEPMEGLAPIIVEELAAGIRAMTAGGDLTCIVVEQQPVLALSMAVDAVILERGRIAHSGQAGELAASADVMQRFLGVNGRTTGAADEATPNVITDPKGNRHDCTIA